MENTNSFNAGKHYIRVTFGDQTLCEEETFPYSSYYLYSINIMSNIKSWTIHKRYKNFDDLYKTLKKKKISDLPKLPPKRLFMGEEAHSERKAKLAKYSNSLLSRADVYNQEEILNFFEIEKEEFLMLKENIEESSTAEGSPKSSDRYKSFSSLQKSKSSDVLINENFFYFQNYDYEERELFTNETKLLIGSFLKSLNSNLQDKCKIIKEFEENFRNKKTGKSFQRDEIYRLLFGEKLDDVFLQGIIHHSGNIEKNQIGAEYCLLFLSNLIDSTHNSDCDYFKDILKLARLPSILEMRLESHLTSNKKSVANATFNILRAVVNEEKGIKLSNILNKSLCEKYESYLCL